jgi:hypothetical protein
MDYSLINVYVRELFVQIIGQDEDGRDTVQALAPLPVYNYALTVSRAGAAGKSTGILVAPKR